MQMMLLYLLSQLRRSFRLQRIFSAFLAVLLGCKLIFRKVVSYPFVVRKLP
jgi:hypothetical protein